MKTWDTLLTIALDLNRSMTAADRYLALLEAVSQVIPYDAACLMTLHGRQLKPRAGIGLEARALTRTYALGDHPRLAIVAQAEEPVLFAADSPLPDPFDQLIEPSTGTTHVHSCLGCPLFFDQQLIGVLTADALQPGKFDHLNQQVLTLFGALAGSVLHTAKLMEQLETKNRHQTNLARELARTAQTRSGGNLIGDSPVMQRLRAEIAYVAPTQLAVLITGETGVGKELVARQVHQLSRRGGDPMVYVNCATLPESLAESELFGHQRGAFTGAEADRMGKFELADGGTLFLDEIGELPPALQPKLLRALQEGEIQRIGSEQLKHVDVRVIAATNRNLKNEVAQGRFREDLFHRLNVVPIHVPPLRERPADIEYLVHHFLEKEKRQLGVAAVTLDPQSLAALSQGAWPGNVRELRNTLVRGLLYAARDNPDRPVLHPRHVRGSFSGEGTPGPMPAPALPLREATEAFQRRTIEEAVAANGGNWTRAATQLGMHRSNLHNLAKRLGLK
ncbi:nitric oxide reductase transcriptional regulator NorR [Acanthopleuribacter pedis]|uniref:Nitric oxide reductase transcriptional regulator NorR n=1 Tax=Acanthopleuribacter pedis TaxID=442870 RepID=A0A8J7U5M5_9BACT|nr:nitric oxide reductase transcriptional regulator NorR [Acanthopleuribacter pedis]MBO1319476.1 nitric oxide reductase transcriptional regulator NorR [Acanthopleuribacter pedis]